MSYRVVSNMDEKVALILSGWSDGCLLDPLAAHLSSRGIRCERVPLPMPPCGCYWLLNPFVVVLVCVLYGMVRACSAAAALDSVALRVVAVMAALAGGALLARLSVAGVVRFSVYHGAWNARRRLSGNVVLVVGFSWGGGVVHALLRAWRGPTLLLNPTIVAMDSISLRSTERVEDPSRVAVVLATVDDFCPPSTATLYETLGCRLRLVDDNHALGSRRAHEACMAGLGEVLS